MSYSREHPSPRYLALLEQYRQMHVGGDQRMGIEARDMFPGKSLMAHVGPIRALIRRVGAKTILDYGSGKGRQYQSRETIDPETGVTHPDIRSYWGVESITCYDPGYAPFSNLPVENFDGVICTDVFEHCPEGDIPWIMEELFSYAEKFVYANVACYPAQKTLPNGENAHCTVRPPEWWRELLATTLANYPGILCEVQVINLVEVDGKSTLQASRMANFD